MRKATAEAIASTRATLAARFAREIEATGIAADTAKTAAARALELAHFDERHGGALTPAEFARIRSLAFVSAGAKASA